MSLLKYLGIKPSAKNVSFIIARELEKRVASYQFEGHLRKSKSKSFLYIQGGYGCRCGCAEQFRFYYDKKQLKISTIWNHEQFNNPLREKRQDFVNVLRKKLRVENIELILHGEPIPEYMVDGKI
jgi:hypothetical protein